MRSSTEYVREWDIQKYYSLATIKIEKIRKILRLAPSALTE